MTRISESFAGVGMDSHLTSRQSGSAFKIIVYLPALFLFIVAVALLFSTAPILVYAQPQITISPNIGFPGSPVTVTGTGFPTATEFAWITITMDNATMSFPQTALTPNGTFTINTSVPPIAPGLKRVTATASSGSASTSFTVLFPQINVSPPYGLPGTNVIISGTFNRAAEFVNITMDSKSLPRVPITANHTFSTSWTAEPPAGVKKVTATGGKDSVSTSFTVIMPKISTSPTSGLPGSPVTIAGTGFPAGTESAWIIITMDGRDMRVPRTALSANGTFSVSGVVPELPAGVRTVTATAASILASASFTVLAAGPPPQPRITVSPPDGKPGSTVRIEGIDFNPGSKVTITIGGIEVATAGVERNGTFITNARIPPLPAGLTMVTARPGQASAELNIFVEPPPPGVPWQWIMGIVIVCAAGGVIISRQIAKAKGRGKIPEGLEIIIKSDAGSQEIEPDAPVHLDNEIRLIPRPDTGRQTIETGGNLIIAERKEEDDER